MGERASMKADPTKIVAEGLGRQESEVPTYLPNAFMQHGAACKAKPGGTGCFLQDDQRTVLIGQLVGRIDDAREAYLTAITSMQVELLVKGDDDLPWLAMLLLDVATAGIASAAGKGLRHLVQGGAGKLAKVAFSAGIHAASDHWSAVALRAVQGLGEKQFERGAKLAVDPLKKVMESEVKEGLALARTTKTEFSAELTALRTQVRTGFQQYRETTPGVASDAELLTLFHGFDAGIQSEQHYAALLSEKMTRFRKSGVTAIGRMQAGRDERFRNRPELENEVGEAVLRDTRVIWAQYAEGGPTELRYQQHDGERVHAVLHPGGEHHPRNAKPEFGPAKPLTAEAELGRVVPVEFHAAAISRHTQVWGVAPPTIQIRAPYWGFFQVENALEKEKSKTKPALQPAPKPKQQPTSEPKPQPTSTTTTEPPAVLTEPGTPSGDVLPQDPLPAQPQKDPA